MSPRGRRLPSAARSTSRLRSLTISKTETSTFRSIRSAPPTAISAVGFCLKELKMRAMKGFLLVTAAATAGFGIAIAAAQQPAGNTVYTAEQATIGQAAFQTTCARCHQADLRGSNEAPPLVGPNFMSAWRGRSTNDLFNKIATSMPADRPGSLPEQAVSSIVAFILRQNGAAAGAQPFTVATAVPIGQVATGAAPPPAATAAATPVAPARAARIPAALTLPGNIQNFTPVTDQMLLKPDPAD